jgi:hypothetical protein
MMRWLYRILLTWGFVAIGLVTLGFALVQRLEAKESEDWPSTTGRITETSVSEERVSSGGRTVGHTEYRPEVRYEYTVDGVAYTGDRMALESRRYRTLGAATADLFDYQQGQDVTVYYDPSHPEQSALEVGLDGEVTIGITIAGLIVGGCGLLFLLLGRMSPNRLAMRVGTPMQVGPAGEAS